MNTPEEVLASLVARCSELKRSKWAPGTISTYRYDWVNFTAWCDRFAKCPLPASTETLHLWAADMLSEGRKVTTVARRLYAVAYYHISNELRSPLTRETHELLMAVRRLRGEQPRQKEPLTVSDLKEICRRLTDEGTPQALRDRALLVMGFTSALRRSNLVSLTLDAVQFKPTGVVIEIRKEKQDKTGRGRYLGLPRGRHRETCPDRTLRAWLKVRGDAPGVLFYQWPEAEPMKGRHVSELVKRWAKSLGYDPADYGAHSLRAGFVTAAAEAGAGELLIASQTGHRSMDVLREYFRRHDLFRSNACDVLRL